MADPVWEDYCRRRCLWFCQRHRFPVFSHKELRDAEAGVPNARVIACPLECAANA
jgi:hypothetical protein